MRSICWFFLTGLAWLGSAALVRAGDSAPGNGNPRSLEFFEKRIRPVLVEQCGKCHSAEAEKSKKLKGGLLLEDRTSLLKGGDSGPAIVPGKAAESLLIKTLRYDGDVRMPPKGKLPDAVIADFESWINRGAVAPETTVASGRKPMGMSLEEGRRFWAYRAPAMPQLPAVQQQSWPINPIDQFILARLEAAGLKPVPEADRATLARRVAYDLTGLPLPLEAVDAFCADTSPDAYEKLVDRLLDSPQFGERWGRHWLDLARFGESLTLRGFIMKEAWRYRDYVIDAFNNDMPLNQFVREQIAGDLLPATSVADRRRQLIATTFLALGNTNLEEQDKKQLRMDVVDEQLDVIGKGLLAQTITCARCHDHKFDPIPTRDYYALAGILRNAKAMEHANVSKWMEVPLPLDPDEETRVSEHERAVAALQAKLKSATAKGGPRKGILAVTEVPGIAVDDAQAKKVGQWQVSQHSGHFVGSGYVHDQNSGKGEKTITFDPDLPASGRYEVRLAYSPGTSRAEAVPVTVFSADGEKTILVDMRKSPPIEDRFISLGEYRFEKAGQSFVIVSNEGTNGHVTADAAVFLPAERAATSDKAGKTRAATGSADATLQAELKRLEASGPKRPMVMTVVEEKQIEDAKVHVRGSVHNQTQAVPRGFLQVATIGPVPTFPTNQSGRKELADWLASRDNPLTARVFANRAWHWLFGAGLVRTTDNFGTTGELPSHPELLDYLAVTFIEEGWSVKKLIRRIVLSRTYRQSVGTDHQADPENRLFGRANRRRLDAEALRDTMLQVSGQLTLDQGGPTYPATLAADYGFKPTDTRRSVYTPVFRNALPEFFSVFDFADSSVVMGQRNVSTTAPQALFLLNHPFPAEQARLAAVRLLQTETTADDARLTRAYRWTVGRPPTPQERAIALRFLQPHQADVTAAWATLFQTLFASADFRYLN